CTNSAAIWNTLPLAARRRGRPLLTLADDVKVTGTRSQTLSTPPKTPGFGTARQAWRVRGAIPAPTAPGLPTRHRGVSGRKSCYKPRTGHIAMPTLPPSRRKRARSNTNAARAVKLATREQRVLQLKSEGWSFREIAQAMQVSHTTVESDYYKAITQIPGVNAEEERTLQLQRIGRMRKKLW